jgi:hypothetical protein
MAYQFWGYSSYGFYMPHPRYCATPAPVREFQEFVEALQAAGLGIIVIFSLAITTSGIYDYEYSRTLATLSGLALF